MQVRHNTQLLEQAVDLLVKRSAIPTLEAEAAAQDKIARATAFRRVATGAAIAIAAIGLGLGGALLFRHVDERVTEQAAKLPKQTEKVSSQSGKQVSETATRIEPKTTAPVPAPKPDIPAPAREPEVVTVDYTKFINRDVRVLGTTWTVTSGHHFKSDKDTTWEKAWCYTRRIVAGVDVNIDLVVRSSPAATPQAPISPGATLASAGLNDASAIELATHCAWLDDVSFKGSEFKPSIDKQQEIDSVQEFISKDGWDALGNDLPNMPLRNISFDQCQNQCKSNSSCFALTYNKKYNACFMKNGAAILVRSDEATMAARRIVENSLQYSTLVFAKDTVVVGHSYSSSEVSHADCIAACAANQTCVGFNFDSQNRICSLMDRVESASEFKGVASGLKASTN